MSTLRKAALGLAVLGGLAITHSAHAQNYSSYNHQISGISVTNSGDQDFGISLSGSTVTFTGLAGSYTVNDVREFALLYATDPTTDKPVPQTTVAIGNVGTQQVAWNPINNPQVYGWADPNNGTLKTGDVQPPFNTGLVFDLASPLTGQGLNNLSYYGFDVSVNVGAGQSDPFGNGVSNGVSTGRVFESLAPTPAAVPEPSQVASLGLGALGLLGLMFKARRRTGAARA